MVPPTTLALANWRYLNRPGFHRVSKIPGAVHGVAGQYRANISV